MLLPCILVGSAILLGVAYLTYGRLLSRLFQLDPDAPTPAMELRDDNDYLPIEPQALLPQHFSAIAAAGPIVGPILAGLMFGWIPALLWILVGSILIGGVHDFSALVASIRHKARSIAEVVRDHMTPRSYLLFLSFVWLALVYIVVAFTDITASSFVGRQTLENGQIVSGGGIATSSLLYLALPLIMGVLLRYTKLSVNAATVIFLPLVGLAIWLGQRIPFDLATILGVEDPTAHKVWDLILLGYCLIAAVLPMWLLLQPRGHLGGYFLYIALIGGGVGLLIGGQSVEYPAFIGFESAKGDPLMPILFITIACGACSGFHSLIASGTTSKQLRRETDARVIGYGAMLLEAMVAIVSLACVMILAKDSKVLAGGPKPNFIYAHGIGNFLGAMGIPAAFGVSFALMAFTTFVYDTLDVCTRLGRYIIQELTGWHDARGKWLGTILTAGAPALFVLQKATDASGKEVPIWQLFWSLFGASNQLLAALTLLGVTVWLWRTRRALWVLFVTGLPTVFMYVMSLWALARIIRSNLASDVVLSRLTASGSGAAAATSLNLVLWIAILLVGLAVLMLIEAVIVFTRMDSTPPNHMTPATA
ncbi:MAG: carbon starvation CstA family protein [Pirellulales bacterium]